MAKRVKEREVSEHREKIARYKKELDENMENVIRYRNTQVETTQALEASLKLPNY